MFKNATKWWHEDALWVKKSVQKKIKVSSQYDHQYFTDKFYIDGIFDETKRMEREMLELILLWCYMLFIHIAVGAGCLKVVYGICKRQNFDLKPVSCLMAGVVAITVYAGIFSIFYKVSAAAHFLLMAVACICLWRCQQEIVIWLKKYRSIFLSWEGVLYLTIVIAAAFFASRGIQHTDTGIYHAQAIRWYEEYGLVKGLGNLQQHFAYNSSSLGYAAAFSMKWLLGRSLHGTNGFLMAALCVWAVHGLRAFPRHKNHLADAGWLAILVYSLVIAERIMSPATDFASMYLVLYILTRWAQIASQNHEEKDLITQGLLCVAAVCAATFKLSAGMLVILAVYPAVVWIKDKQWKRIIFFVTMGIVVLLPYLIRNILISGWLVYPLAFIDLFEVDWKVPVQFMQYDSDQIKVWGRCLFDVSKIDMPVQEWIRIWWDAKDTYEKMLIEANLTAAVLWGLDIIHNFILRYKINWQIMILDIAVAGGLAGWFFTAPFIRYGLAFLLIFPFMQMGKWIRTEKLGPARIAAGACGAVCFLFLSYYWSYYGLFHVQWIKAHLADPFYIQQQDYDIVEVNEYQMGNEIIYYPSEGENISYHAFPAGAYLGMIERTQLREENIADGFRTID